MLKVTRLIMAASVLMTNTNTHTLSWPLSVTHAHFYFAEQRESNSSPHENAYIYQSDECVSYLCFADPSDPISPKEYPTSYPPKHPDAGGKDTKSNEVLDKQGTSHTLSPHTPVRGRSLIHHSLCVFILFLLSKCQSSVTTTCTLIRSHKILLTSKSLM